MRNEAEPDFQKSEFQSNSEVTFRQLNSKDTAVNRTRNFAQV